MHARADDERHDVRTSSDTHQAAGEDHGHYHGEDHADDINGVFILPEVTWKNIVRSLMNVSIIIRKIPDPATRVIAIFSSMPSLIPYPAGRVLTDIRIACHYGRFPESAFALPHVFIHSFRINCRIDKLFDRKQRYYAYRIVKFRPMKDERPS